MPPVGGNRRIVGNTSAILKQGTNTGGTIVGANAGSNVAGGTVPAGATSLYMYSAVPFRVSLGEATSGSVGIPFGTGGAVIGVQRIGGTINYQPIGAAGTLHYGFSGGS